MKRIIIYIITAILLVAFACPSSAAIKVTKHRAAITSFSTTKAPQGAKIATDYDPRYDEANCIFYFNANMISGVTGDAVSSWTDDKANGLTVEQSTASAQGVLFKNVQGGNNAVRFVTDDFLEAKDETDSDEYDLQAPPSYHFFDSTSGNGQLRLVGFNDADLETLGSDLFDANVYLTGTGSWALYGSNTKATISGENGLEISYVDNAQGAYLYFRDAHDLSSNLTVGSLYKFVFSVKVNTGSADFETYYDGSTRDESISLTTSYVTYTRYFIADVAMAGFIKFQNMSAGEKVYFKDPLLYEVTNTGIAQYAGSNNVVTIKDSNDKVIKGYIGAASSAYSDTNIYSDDMSADNTGDWALSSAALSFDTDHYELEVTSADGGMRRTGQSVTAGRTYEIACEIKNGTASNKPVKLKFNDGGSILGGTQNTTASWSAVTDYFVASTTTSSAYAGVVVGQDISGTSIELRNFTFDEVDDFGTDAVAIYSDKALTTRGFGGDTVNFNFNDTYIARVESEDWSQTGDQSYIVILKPDDGQPASASAILTKNNNTNDQRGPAIVLETNGKFYFNTSSDGTNNNEWEITDDVIYSDGAASSYSMIGVVKDGASCSLYHNATALASTTGAGGIPATNYDTPSSLMIGYADDGFGYLSGDIALVLGYSDAKSADAISRIYWGTYYDRPN